LKTTRKIREVQVAYFSEKGGAADGFMWHACQRTTIWPSSQRMYLTLNNGRQISEGGGNDGLSVL